ncbi:MAG: ferritin-like domain-containing protein [Gemmatimonadaceae bacterium]|nr:ferritin-like domain-containing protein [Gemmatimonadaceae bacterium]
MAHQTLQNLYVDQLRDLYNAENQILKVLPKMAEKASHADLADAFRQHEQQTRGHVERLERIFNMLGESPKGERCKGMEGVLDEGADVMKKFGDTPVLDAAMITAAQRVEHYEMAGYGCVRTFANELGFADQETLLQQTLDEEGATDQKLTKLAEEVVNLDAVKA